MCYEAMSNGVYYLITTILMYLSPTVQIPRCIINPCPISEAVKNETSLHLKKCYRSNDCFDAIMTTHCSMVTQEFGFCCTAECKSISNFIQKISVLQHLKHTWARVQK